MIAVTYLLCCGIFYGLFVWLKLLPRTYTFVTVFNGALSVMSDKTLSDDVKEPLIQQAALIALRTSAKLIASLVFILLVSALPLVVAAGFNLVSVGGLMGFALKPAVLTATLVGMGTAELLRRYLKG